jgi:hypothetical protein
MAEQMSKNVTKILEGLLKDYDKTERPAFKSGELLYFILVWLIPAFFKYGIQFMKQKLSLPLSLKFILLRFVF